MKNIFKLAIGIGLTLGVISCGEDQPTYKVEGTIAGAPNTQIVLMASGDPSPESLDTTSTDANGHFVMKHHRNRPFNMFIYKITGEWYIDLIGEAVDMKLTADVENEEVKNIKVKAGKNNALKDKFLSMSQVYVDSLDKMDLKLSSGQESSAEEQDQFNKVLDEYISLAEKFILEQEVSFYTFSMMSSMLSNIEDVAVRTKMIEKFGNTYNYAPEYNIVKMVANADKELKDLAPLPNSDVENLAGEKGKFHDYKGEQFTVIDFWATWCQPCIREFPHIAELYNEFDGKGVNFVSYNLDEEPKAWKKKGGDLGITWHNISENKGFDSEVSKFLRINSIPHLVVVDSKMKVVSKFLGLGASERVKKFLEASL